LRVGIKIFLEYSRARPANYRRESANYSIRSGSIYNLVSLPSFPSVAVSATILFKRENARQPIGIDGRIYNAAVCARAPAIADGPQYRRN